MTRRAFTTGGIASALALAGRRASAEERAPKTPPTGKWKTAIIGHTGEGDYGHGLDLIFNGRGDIEVAAIADADAAGRARAATRCKAARQYGDWREMLDVEKPQLVSLAPRWTHERHAMAMAALRGGAHLFCEKPFTTTLSEADEVLALAQSRGSKIAVAHQQRLAPSTVHLKKAIGDGLIGDLLEMRAWGKQDERAGGEDMIVLGSHLFDLMRLFAGDATSCTARVLHQGRDITKQDARTVKERIGPVAGDEISAQFAFAHGVNGTFTSRKRLRQSVGFWGIEFIGSKATARLLSEIFPTLYLQKSGEWTPAGRVGDWQRLDGDPGKALSAEERGFGPANQRLVDDWLAAIVEDREPACSGRGAMKAIEMIMAVYHAARGRRRVTLPLEERAHPLA